MKTTLSIKTLITMFFDVTLIKNLHLIKTTKAYIGKPIPVLQQAARHQIIYYHEFTILSLFLV